MAEQTIAETIWQLISAQERLVGRMLGAWKFEEWGEPALAIQDNQPTSGKTLFNEDSISLTSNITGLCRTNSPMGEHCHILVQASDHLEETAEAPGITEDLIKKVLWSRTMPPPLSFPVKKPTVDDDGHGDNVKTSRALAALDAGASAWARGAGLTRAVAVMLTHDDREARLEAYIKMVWGEGAWAARHSMTAEEIEDAARGAGESNPHA